MPKYTLILGGEKVAIITMRAATPEETRTWRQRQTGRPEPDAAIIEAINALHPEEEPEAED